MKNRGDIQSAYQQIKRHANMPPMRVQKHHRGWFGVKDKHDQWVSDQKQQPILFELQKDAERFSDKAESMARRVYKQAESTMSNLDVLLEDLRGSLTEGHAETAAKLVAMATKARGKMLPFTAHGNKFHIKFKSPGTYVVMAEAVKQRNRWGNKAEITQDVEHIYTHGTLPQPSGSRW
jgi:hypothetical protein